jgi:hypothetical protein
VLHVSSGDDFFSIPGLVEEIAGVGANDGVADVDGRRAHVLDRELGAKMSDELGDERIV